MPPKINIFNGAGSIKYLLYENTDAQGISGVIKAHGSYEPNLKVISSAILNSTQGNLILDIGANLGSYSIPLANDFPQKTFILFEPQRLIYYQLCGNIFLNGLNNASALNFGLGKIQTSFEINVPDYQNDHNIGAFSLNPEMQKNLRGGYSLAGALEIIQVKALDSMNYENIALIKIDVEGMEHDVLIGGVGSLVRNLYPPIIYEAWDFEWHKEGRLILESFLIDLGYKIIKFDRSFNYLAQHPKNVSFLKFN